MAHGTHRVGIVLVMGGVRLQQCCSNAEISLSTRGLGALGIHIGKALSTYSLTFSSFFVYVVRLSVMVRVCDLVGPPDMLCECW